MKSNQNLWVLGQRVTIIETIGDYSMIEVSATPDVPGPPPHYHVDAPELFHIVSGKMDILSDGQWTTLKTGENLIVPEKVVHTFRNRSSEACRFITTWAPRGFEGFFLEFGIP